jgi:hypothetical protein
MFVEPWRIFALRLVAVRLARAIQPGLRQFKPTVV